METVIFFNGLLKTQFIPAIPPEIGFRYRRDEMKFWNEYLPELIRNPKSEPPPIRRPKKPRPTILDYADGLTKLPNQGQSVTSRLPSLMNEEYPRTETGGETVTVEDPPATTESSPTKNSSMMPLVVGFGIVFLMMNLMAFFYIYCRRQGLRAKEKSLKRRLSQKDDGSKRSKLDKQPEKNVELGQKRDSKPDLNEVLKNDKAYDNNSNFGRRSKLSRQNSSSTIDTHIKVREWIQQEIVHRSVAIHPANSWRAIVG